MAMSLIDALLPELDHELTTTRRLLERAPEDRFDWKPHEKSMSLGALTTHLANLPTWTEITIKQSEFDVAAWPPPPLVASRLARLGSDAYFVPLGGSNATGTLAFVDAASELAGQVRRGETPEPDVIVVASGSGGTVAGLAVGLEKERLRTRVIGVAVSPVPPTGAIHPVAERGQQPLFTPDGTRIIYRDGRRFYEVPFTTTSGFRTGRPSLLAEGPFIRTFAWNHTIGPDGRLAALLSAPGDQTRELGVITGFDRELTRLAPARQE